MQPATVTTPNAHGLTAAEWAASPAGQRHDAIAGFTESSHTPRRCLTGTPKARYLLAGHQFRRSRRLAAQAQDYIPTPRDTRRKPGRHPLATLLAAQKVRRAAFELAVRDRKHYAGLLAKVSARNPPDFMTGKEIESIEGCLRGVAERFRKVLQPIPHEPHYPLRLVDIRANTGWQQERMLRAAGACAAIVAELAA